MKKKRRVCALFLTASILWAMFLPAKVLAHADAATIDSSIGGTFTIEYMNPGDGSPVEGARFVVRRIAEPSASVFGEDGGLGGVRWISLIRGVDEADMEEALRILAKVKKAYEIEDLEGGKAYTGKTSDKGLLTFTDMPQGIYLVEEEENAEGYFPSEPFVFSLPFTDIRKEQDTTTMYWNYEVKAKPKPRRMPVTDVETTEATEPETTEPETEETLVGDEQEASNPDLNSPPKTTRPSASPSFTYPSRDTTKSTRLVKTGDETRMVFFALTGIAAVVSAVIVLVVLKERRRRADEVH